MNAYPLKHEESPREQPLSSPDGEKKKKKKLWDILDRLAMTCYYETLLTNGFESWDHVLDITESDLGQLLFKRGHRRKLQREIANYRQQQAPISATKKQVGIGRNQGSSSLPMAGRKRKPNSGYGPSRQNVQRHYLSPPLVNDDVPSRPEGAYRNFSNAVYTEGTNAQLPFTERVKKITEDWETLPSISKLQSWAEPAEREMKKYQTEADHSHLRSAMPPSHTPFSRRISGFHAQPKPLRKDPKASERSAQNISLLDSAYHAVDVAMVDLMPTLQTRHPTLQRYDATHLPHFDTVLLAVTAFFNNTGSRLFMWSAEEASETISTVFNSTGEPDAYALMDLLAMAAIGSLCDSNCLPKATSESFYLSCLDILNACVEARYLPCMRLLTSLSYYCTLTKPDTAWKLNAAALEIGRLQLIHQAPSAEMDPRYCDHDERRWRKVFRTVIFMQCWFHYGLGLELGHTERDIFDAFPQPTTCDTCIEEIIYTQTSRVGLLASKIASDIRLQSQPSVALIRLHMESLDRWYRELPSAMSLTTLNSDCSEVFSYHQKRSILLVHLLSLAAAVLLHKPVLVAMAKFQVAGIWSLKEKRADCGFYQEYCFSAARQASRIAGLLKQDIDPPRHCWVIIFQSLTACATLLLSSSQKLLNDTGLESVEEDLTGAKKFMDLLAWCGDTEPLSLQYMKKLEPLYDALRSIQAELSGNRRRMSEGVEGEDTEFRYRLSVDGRKLMEQNPDSIQTATYAPEQEQQGEFSMTDSAPYSGAIQGPGSPRMREQLVPIVQQIIGLLINRDGAVHGPNSGLTKGLSTHSAVVL
ncbi:hypothetical protein GQ43DRAFT_60889 [Delitschia confertaspora ATCC 74209]|uniref:HMG box domain-containing protein n=1 Tax=Delitschia confertaspora ATCC 74209 TaxID=1513339 RepID=A0A9P4MV50_9PLEO|nr:hypothetical protein GQ43DRAFT_60889 [Delitschia confertaspora ATCC 74209]